MYVIRSTYLETAMQKCADPEQLASLEALAEAVSTTDQLACDLPGRLAAARAAAEITQPPLSRAARDQVAVSADATRRVDQLLTRACGRAADAPAVIRSLADAARDDLEFEEFLAEHAQGHAAQDLIAELVAAKRVVVQQIDAFLGRFL